MGKATLHPMRSKSRGHGRHVSGGEYGTVDSPVSRADALNSLGSVVYALRTRDGLIKIGFTSRLGGRAGNLGGMDRLLAVRMGATVADEQAIHDTLSGLAVRGREYYPPVPEVLHLVNEMRRKLRQPPIAA